MKDNKAARQPTKVARKNNRNTTKAKPVSESSVSNVTNAMETG